MSQNVNKELYDLYVEEIQDKLNRKVNIVLFICIIAGPLVACGQYFGIFHDVSYFVCFLTPILTFVLALIQRILISRRNLGKAAKYVGIVAVEFIIVLMASSNMSVSIAYTLPSFICVLYFDLPLFIGGSVLSYIGHIAAMYFTSAYVAEMRIDYTASSYFWDMFGSATIQHIIMFSIGIILCRVVRTLVLKSCADNVNTDNYRLGGIVHDAMSVALLKDTPDEALEALMEYVGKHLSSDRAYIFEDLSDQNITYNTYEWCDEGVVPQIDELQGISLSEFSWWYDYFEKGENVIIKDLERIKESEPSTYALLAPQNINSLIVCPITKGKDIIGFFGVDNPSNLADEKNSAVITTTLAMLGDFILSLIQLRDSFKQRLDAAAVDSYNTLASIYSTIGFVNPDTDSYRSIVANDRFRNIFIEKESINVASEIRNEFLRYVGEKDVDVVKEFMDFSTLAERMKNSLTIFTDFYTTIEGYCRARFIKVTGRTDVTEYVFALERIDEEKRKENHLKYLSETDLMTGLRNRGSGEATIKKIIKSGEKGSFLLIDADNFKSINDTFGHDVGDKVIVAIAEALKQVTTSDEVVMRLGGDEYALYIPGVTGEDKIEEVKNNFFRNIESINISEMKGRKVEVSMGIAVDSKIEESSFDELYKMADQALYGAKKLLGNAAMIYHK